MARHHGNIRSGAWVAGVSLCALMIGVGCRVVEGASDPTLVVYSGRTEALVAPVVEAFERSEGVRVRVQYADTSQLAAMLVEEGDRTRADVFLAQDAATMGFLGGQGLLAPLSDDLLQAVDPRFRATDGQWVGVSGRARVLAYHPDRVSIDELPDNLHDLLDPRWQSRLGWTPDNASFRAFVAALFQLEGGQITRAWLQGMKAHDPRAFPSNTPAVLAVAHGEVDAVLTNHYYLHRLKAERGDDFPVANHYFRSGDAASLVNVSAVGVLASSPQHELAERFAAWLLSDEAQRHFAEVNFEFPLARGATPVDGLPSIAELEVPALDLSDLGALQTTSRLMRDTGTAR